MIIYLKKKTFKKYILFSNKNLTILVFYIFFFNRYCNNVFLLSIFIKRIYNYSLGLNIIIVP